MHTYISLQYHSAINTPTAALNITLSYLLVWAWALIDMWNCVRVYECVSMNEHLLHTFKWATIQRKLTKADANGKYTLREMKRNKKKHSMQTKICVHEILMQFFLLLFRVRFACKDFHQAKTHTSHGIMYYAFLIHQITSERLNPIWSLLFSTAEIPFFLWHILDGKMPL